MLKVVVCVSGGGTNLQAVMDAMEKGEITNAKITGVISNNQNAFALERARKAGIPAFCISPKDYEDRGAFHKALLGKVRELAPNLIVLAGYLVTIPAEMIEAYKNRIINIHPSLIPAFCGVGYYGLKVHEGALARGVRISGATVHFVDAGTDTGPIIFQKAVLVKPDDTPKTLQQRIMEEAEWKILPKAIDYIANGKIRIEDGKVMIEDGKVLSGE